MTVHEPARDIKVRAEVDILVVGGGPSGVMAAYAAARIFSGLDQMMKADAALKKINLTAAAADASAIYGYWASLAKQLDEQIHPQTASVAAPAEAKPAEAKPAEAPAAAAETPAA